jgi:hypothetical protein
MPQWLFPLLTLLWNHHTFQRGKRAGKSPLELAGVEDVPALAEVLIQLVSAKGQTEPEATKDAETLVQLESLLYSEPTRVAA